MGQARPVHVGFQPAWVENGSGPPLLADLLQVLRLQGAEIVAAPGQQPILGAHQPERLSAGDFPLLAGETLRLKTLARHACHLGQRRLPGLRARLVQTQRHHEIERPVGCAPHRPHRLGGQSIVQQRTQRGLRPPICCQEYGFAQPAGKAGQRQISEIQARRQGQGFFDVVKIGVVGQIGAAGEMPRGGGDVIPGRPARCIGASRQSRGQSQPQSFQKSHKEYYSCQTPGPLAISIL